MSSVSRYPDTTWLTQEVDPLLHLGWSLESGSGFSDQSLESLSLASRSNTLLPFTFILAITDNSN